MVENIEHRENAHQIAEIIGNHGTDGFIAGFLTLPLYMSLTASVTDAWWLMVLNSETMISRAVCRIGPILIPLGICLGS